MANLDRYLHRRIVELAGRAMREAYATEKRTVGPAWGWRRRRSDAAPAGLFCTKSLLENDHPSVQHLMSYYNVAQAKTKFSELVRRALAGEDVVIALDNKPMVRLVPFARPSGKRRPGSASRLIGHVSPDFDTTPDDFAKYR